ncbi:hypothetical protein Scep_003915 [Stephania cephalantha]|uniref:Nudix hydrolase domain-containing protein n=1 Tax=Stephania cephalantha TaxID=152367 RepID=A0AAP0KRF3_9MAGN
MCDLVARTGRLHQRYDSGCRLVAGQANGVAHVMTRLSRQYASQMAKCNEINLLMSVDALSEKVVEVLMINSTSGPGLLFPKGGWENDETVEQAAEREALEEAGVRGDLLFGGHHNRLFFANNLMEYGLLGASTNRFNPVTSLPHVLCMSI